MSRLAADEHIDFVYVRRFHATLGPLLEEAVLLTGRHALDLGAALRGAVGEGFNEDILAIELFEFASFAVSRAHSRFRKKCGLRVILDAGRASPGRLLRK